MKKYASKLYDELLDYFKYDHKTEIPASDLVELYNFKLVELMTLICCIDTYFGLKLELNDGRFKFFDNGKEFSCRNFKLIKECN